MINWLADVMNLKGNNLLVILKAFSYESMKNSNIKGPRDVSVTFLTTE